MLPIKSNFEPEDLIKIVEFLELIAGLNDKQNLWLFVPANFPYSNSSWVLVPKNS